MAVMIATVPAVTEPMTMEARLSDAWLSVVVVRLLAVSLAMTRRRSRLSDGIGRGLPKGYRAWPVLDSGAGLSDSAEFRRFYICPKGAGTVDDEEFPVGTVMVVETYGLCDADRSLEGGTESDRWLQSIFVLEKFASLQSCCGSQGEQGAWMYATYDAEGRAVFVASASCGVGRVAASAREMRACRFPNRDAPGILRSVKLVHF